MSKGRRTEVTHVQLVSRAVLRPDDETELYELSQLSGVIQDPRVFKILLDLLKLNVPPEAIVQTLRSMCSHHGSVNSGEALGYGEPHPYVPASRRDASHAHQNRSDSSYSATGDGLGWAGSHDHHARSSSRDHSGQQMYNNFQDGSSNLSYTTSSHDNLCSFEQTKLTSDTTYDGYRSRPADDTKQIPASRIDSFVTTRQSVTSDSYSYRDRINKK